MPAPSSYAPSRPVAIAGLAAALLLPVPSSAQVREAEADRPSHRAQHPYAGAAHDGAAALGLALRRLGAGGRVLMVAAHPDDENTSLLATLALRDGAEVAYLSLTRGEGGQNGIGTELGAELGLLRSEELLAARRLDGGLQFFTRAFDFGYSKSAAETFSHWPRDSVLADVVEVVRRFRPDVMVTIFSGTPADGHGQHHAAGILAREGFEAAARADAFPDQLRRGLRPHAPATLLQARWWGAEDAPLELQAGALDPLLGRSHHQIAMASRGRHRSQDMGRLEEPGPRTVSMEVVARTGEHPPGSASPAPLPELSLTLADRARRLAGVTRGLLADALHAYEAATHAVRQDARLLFPGELTGPLGESLALLRDAAEHAAELGGPGAAELRFHIDAEARDLRRALRLASGLRLEAVASRERVAPGQDFELELRLWNGGTHAVPVSELVPELPRGWSAVLLDPAAELAAETRGEGAGGSVGAVPPTSRSAAHAASPATTVGPGKLLVRRFRISVPTDAPFSQPYFLEQPRQSALYAWPADPVLRGLPFEPDPVRATARVVVSGADLPLEADAEFIGADRTYGEFRRPVLVVPSVAVELDPALVIFPAADPPGDGIPVEARLRAEVPTGTAGALRLELPAGWRAEPGNVAVRFDSAGEERRATFAIHPPTAVAPGAVSIRATFLSDDGGEHDTGYELVDYEHIRPRASFRPAVATLGAIDVALPGGLDVGYVMGAGDDVPEAIRQLGARVELLGEADLASGDLGRFDAIVIGVRAYEFRRDLPVHNERLLDYVRAGGTLIVQYNQYGFVRGDYAPYPLEIARPHDRVTDPAASVRMLAPEHPLLATPNRLTGADFEGWVQERGLYFARSWDDAYTPLLAMSDPGEPPLEGGLLAARVGRGHYVYTGLALFRQLPAGVPGAYRLLANLLALGSQDDAP